MAWYKFESGITSRYGHGTPDEAAEYCALLNTNGGDWVSSEIEATADIKEHCGAIAPLIAEKRDEEDDRHMDRREREYLSGRDLEDRYARSRNTQRI
jgi:hypothetical protein